MEERQRSSCSALSRFHIYNFPVLRIHGTGLGTGALLRAARQCIIKRIDASTELMIALSQYQIALIIMLTT